MAVRPRTNELYEAIRSEHERLINVKEYGVQKYSDGYILQKLASKFFREARTIENIIYYRV